MDQANPIIKKKFNWPLAGVLILIAATASYFIYQAVFIKNVTYETISASRGTLTAQIGATGVVKTNHSANLIWNSSGIVEAVNIKIGDTVKTDQVLAFLAKDSTPQNIHLAEADFLNNQLKLTNLLNSNTDIAQAMKNLSIANQAAKDAQDSFDYISRKRVTNELIQDISDQIDGAKRQVKMLDYFYRRFFSHRADGTTNKAQMISRVTTARQNVIDLTAKYNWYTSRASDLEVQQSKAALNLAIARADDAQRDLDRLMKNKNADNIRTAEVKLAASKSIMQQAQIISPFDGVITKTSINLGDRVSPGLVAIRIDDIKKLVIDLQISEVDINNVNDGQAVTITLDAIPNKIYNGLVTRVNKSAKPGQGGINFQVSIAFSDADENVKPGMSASVSIIVKNIESTLLVPNKAIRMVNGQRIVYILKNNEAFPVTIRLGASADENSQVVGGDLKEGDLIILNPPNISSASGQASTVSATPIK